MKYPHQKFLFIILATLMNWPIGVLNVSAASEQQCVPYRETTYPMTGIEVTYDLAGKVLVQHQFKGVAEGDKIIVETSLLDYTYTQHIHKTSRQIVWTSQPISTRDVPGVLPQSNTTDLWIPPSTTVGSRINIQNQSLLVGQITTSTIFVGDTSDKSTVGAREYDAKTGAFVGINGSDQTPILKDIKLCTEAPSVPPTVSFSTSATIPSDFILNHENLISISVTNNGSAVQGFIIDFEIYDSSGNKIFQQIKDVPNDTFAAGSTRSFDFQWTPANTGNFIGTLGIFTSNWQSPLSWNNELIPRMAVGSVADNGEVMLLNGFVTSTPYFLSQRAVLHALFTTQNPPSKKVLLDLELYNPSNQKIEQAVFDDVSIADANAVDKLLEVPLFLPDGKYRFKVGIFNPHWNGLIHWYDTVAQFELKNLGQYEDNNIVLGFATSTPSIITQGQESTLISGFVSPFTQNHFYLDLTLTDASGAIVAERTLDNVAIPRSGTGNFENIYTLQAPTNLVPGMYFFNVSIFTLGKGNLIHDYPKAATLLVQDDG